MGLGETWSLPSFATAWTGTDTAVEVAREEKALTCTETVGLVGTAGSGTAPVNAKGFTATLLVPLLPLAVTLLLLRTDKESVE